jgi:S1-C subfamily serine protease
VIPLLFRDCRLGLLWLAAALLVCCGALAAETKDDAASISPADLALVKAAEAARVRTIESVYGAVVAVYGNDRAGGGSAVLFDPAGYALTNHHVVAAAGDEGWAGLADGKLYRWQLIGTDPGGDVAIIKLRGQKNFPAAPLGDSAKVRVGDWAMAMGNPFVLAEDQRPTVTLGIVSGVNRFQEGAGLNQLVYGNCIQVDSSINPGNSGGPLFNLQGEIIGINGRGSFQERGRVNVGLGYAISSGQVKNFIPELLATKIAQHGTLDAVFGTRGGQVVCHTLNLDAPIAKQGLQLGDRLLAFEGQPLTNGNQLMNWISTYPAHWPVSVTFERDGQPRTVFVRLTPLPYEPLVNPMPEPQPAPEKPSEEKPPAEKPPQKIVVPRAELPLGEAGKIRDRAVNQSLAASIAARWQAECRVADATAKSSAIRLVSDLVRDGKVVGKQTLLVARDGRARADYELDGEATSVLFDGKTYTLAAPDREAREVTQAKALRDPHFAQAAVLGAILAEKPLARYGEVLLDGSDKAQGRLCYRLSATDPRSEQLFVWLSVFGNDDKPHVQLLKSGVGIAASEPIPSVLYNTWRAVGDVRMPFKRKLVLGLAEREQLALVTTAAERLQKLDDSLFMLPKDAGR